MDPAGALTEELYKGLRRMSTVFSGRSRGLSIAAADLVGGFDLSQTKSPYADSQEANLELAKWLALATMFVDHYGKIVDQDLYLPTHAVGRLSFPLFATIIGLRLAQRPERASRYVKRLLPWAIISQPVFVVAGRDWFDGNILLTLLLGVLATDLVRRYISIRAWPLLLALVVLLAVAWFCEFGPVGAMMVPLTAMLASNERRHRGLWASGPLGLAANLTLARPPLQWVDLTSLLASVAAIGSTKLPVRLPRLPTHFFYASYPGHLLALHYYDLSAI